jgi:hypothetical protein
MDNHRFTTSQTKQGARRSALETYFTIEEQFTRLPGRSKAVRCSNNTDISASSRSVDEISWSSPGIPHPQWLLP